MNEEGMKRWGEWQQGWSVLWLKEGPETGDPAVLVHMVGSLVTKSQGFQWIAQNAVPGQVYHIVWLGRPFTRSADGLTWFVGGASCTY
jgi:hypothetical protein